MTKLAAMLGLAVGIVSATAWEPATAPLQTRWAETVAPTNAHRQYPRPQMVRSPWRCLNGLWDYALRPNEEGRPKTYDGKILVPFPIESALSGVRRPLNQGDTLWYRRFVKIPARWQNKRVLLHFGGVDWETTVYINGKQAGVHRGGYDPFCFDITDHLRWTKREAIIVAVRDSTGGDQPRGKQSLRPQGVFYSQVGGIWQTVWMEPVANDGIRGLRMEPDLEGKQLRLQVLTRNPDSRKKVTVRATAANEQVGRVVGKAADDWINLPLSKVRPWSPETPFLYNLEVTLVERKQQIDRVTSYFGMREIKVVPGPEGLAQIALNGKQYFQLGVLDQGYWPEGLYTAPSDAAIRADIEAVKRLGFNMIRKHVKVEPALWYYWCDRLGVLVWQDMPSAGNTDRSARQQFEVELRRMIESRRHHPSIVMWTLFNEAWGQFDTKRLTECVKALDPTRLVNSASGWTDHQVGDVIDVHGYPDPPTAVAEPSRAAVVGEFGGLGLYLGDHCWGPSGWSYKDVSGRQWLVTHYANMLSRIRTQAGEAGLSGAVYCQLTDVETECNGLMTYDRSVLKVDETLVNALNRGNNVTAKAIVVVPNALQKPVIWRYTTELPHDGWELPDFDDLPWQEGPAGFGKRFTQGSRVRTDWRTRDIWLRRRFVLPDPVPSDLTLHLHVDENAEIYINGISAARVMGHLSDYTDIELPRAAQQTLVPGTNTFAVHCANSYGGQYIDVGLRSLGITRLQPPGETVPLEVNLP